MIRTKLQRVRRISMVAAKCALALGLALAVVFIVQTAHSSDDLFPVSSIEVVDAQRLDVGKLTETLAAVLPANLLAVDLHRARALVESEAWVDAAVVRRKLPDRLIIHVRERVPVAVAAIENQLFVVDRHGVILDDFGPQYETMTRPIVQGLRSIAVENAGSENRQRMQRYLEVIRELSAGEPDHTASISEIDVGSLERIAVVANDDPVPIYLGKEEFRSRYEVFLSQKDLYLRLKEKYGLIEYVDVTYDRKIIFHTPKSVVTG
ncbi:MAG TPA: FtsQ-type POTRA domain-containing protein [Acidobacteriota bacterium]|nr:FtsQ-type POTRA domain-containing protein [Acidobacteriota bacterium]